MAHLATMWNTSRNLFVYRGLIDVKYSINGSANPGGGYYLIDIVNESMGKFFVVDTLYMLEKVVEASPNTNGAAPTFAAGVCTVTAAPGGGFNLTGISPTTIHGDCFQPFTAYTFITTGFASGYFGVSDHVVGTTSFNKLSTKSNVIVDPGKGLVVRNSSASDPAPANGSHYYVSVFIRGYHLEYMKNYSSDLIP